MLWSSWRHFAWEPTLTPTAPPWSRISIPGRSSPAKASGISKTASRLHADQVRRLACDGRVQPLIENGSTRPFGIGRASRKVPDWLLRHIKERDGGCRFPGCTHDRWLHAHHIRHWANGGATDSENLVMLCGFHHRLVHDGGWVMIAHDNRTLEFIRPDGRALDAGPPPLRAEIRTRFFASDP